MIRLCVVSFAVAGMILPAVAVEWSLGHNAVREGEFAIIDTHGKRTGGPVHGKIDLGDMTGGVRATIRARGCGIGRPDKSYFGLKFMFRYIDPATGATKWPQAYHRGGDFDFNDIAEISADGTFTAKRPGESVVLATALNGDREIWVCTVAQNMI